MIHAIVKNKDDLRLIDILRQRTTDLVTKKKAIELLEKFGSISYTMERIKSLDELCRKLILEFGNNQELIQLLDHLMI
jgi:geranylgeranyl pyrophosphate synthase